THKKQFVHLLRSVRQRIDELESQYRDLELTIEELREIETQVLDAMQEAGMVPPPASVEPEREPEQPARGAVRRRPARASRPKEARR
ncbi:MAG TPA: hypothetical protein VE078_08370, partial [Thermoanaerobaculia bacterium]|nr:hypothetical protein [Thermoanaerobaculia bacterium]